MSTSKQRTSADPTSLLDHPADGTSTNCLAQAALFALDGADDVVFLSAPGDAAAPGHVVLRDRRTGAVREPDAVEATLGSVEALLAVSGRHLLAIMPPALLRGVLALAPPQRPAALGEPVAAIAHLAFGAVGAITPLPSSNTPKTHPSTEATDSHVSSWLDAMGNAVSSSDKAALAQTGNDAQTLLNWFNSFSRGDPKLNDMPQPIADAENRLLANDAVAKRITVNGQVTRDALGSFLKDVDGSADSAKSSWQAFQKDNKTPDPVAQQEAVDTSILQANMGVLDAAGSSAAKVDGKINLDDVKAVAGGAGNSALPDPVKNAAAFYANSGEFDKLANAGLSPSQTSDGLVQNNNFDSLLSQGTTKNEDDTISDLTSAAIQQAVTAAGGDASKLDPSYFSTGQSNASGADKTAALLQLGQGLGRLDAGWKAFQIPEGDSLNSDSEWSEWYSGPSPKDQIDSFTNQVQGQIDKLSQDPDVQSFLAQNFPGSLSSIVGSDPAMKAAAQTQFDAASSTDALTKAFASNDSTGGSDGTINALSSFVGKANFYWQALGNGADGSTPDYSKALDGAPQSIKDQVKQGYDDITSGNEINTLVKNGTPEDQAIIKSASDKTVYDSVLDKDTVAAGTDRFNDTVAALGRGDLTDGKSVPDMLKGLGISSGDPNDPQLEQMIESNINTLIAPDKSNPSSAQEAGDVLSAIRQINDAIRGGLKFDDAVGKVTKSWTPSSGSLPDAYKAGVLHAASAVLLAGAMGAKIAGGQGSTQTAAQSLSIAGLLTEGGAKYYGTTLQGLKNTVAADKTALATAQTLAELPNANPNAVKIAQDQLNADSTKLSQYTNIGKDVENTGKLLGGVAGNALGFISGVIGAVKSAQNGDIGAAAAQGTFAGLNGISTVASAGEIAAYVLPRVGILTGDAATAAGIAGGVFGAVGGVVGGIAAVGGLIYSIIEGFQEEKKYYQQAGDWYKQLQADFAPTGLTLPDEGTLLSPPYGVIPPQDVAGGPASVE
jgi:hypothetical protein